MSGGLMMKLRKPSCSTVVSDAVNVWIQADSGVKVVPLDGGLGRVDEIRSELEAQWRVGEELLARLEAGQDPGGSAIILL